jgi:hypothetical protein
MVNVKNMVTKEYAPYCVICRTHNHKAGYGIAFENGTHICMECALDVYDILDDCFKEQASQMDEAEDSDEDTAHGGDD